MIRIVAVEFGSSLAFPEVLLLVKNIFQETDKNKNKCVTACASGNYHIWTLLNNAKNFKYLETRCFKKSLWTLCAEVSSLIVMLFPVQNGRVSVCKLYHNLHTEQIMISEVG